MPGVACRNFPQSECHTIGFQYTQISDLQLLSGPEPWKVHPGSGLFDLKCVKYFYYKCPRCGVLPVWESTIKTPSIKEYFTRIHKTSRIFADGERLQFTEI